jgi:zinc protease
MMTIEADRMTGLVLDDAEVASERQVVVEERKMRVDSEPQAQLQEGLFAALYVHHPYGTPIIGWGHEIEGLTREDALAYYRRFYCPENAVLVVAGDVEPQEVRERAERTYGRIPRRNLAPPQRARLREPELHTERFLKVADTKVEQPMSWRAYRVPCYANSRAGEAHALEVLAHLMGGGATSRLHRVLVMQDRIAVQAGASYWGDALDSGIFSIHAVPAEGVSLEALDAALDAVLETFRTGPSPERDLARTRTRLVADMIYAQDSQGHLARIYGNALTTGGAISDVADWPARIRAVDGAGVQAAARLLRVNSGAIGHLVKAA